MPAEALQLQPTWLDAQHPREGRYVLGPLLGQGGMGEVVEAWDVVLRRAVALKILRRMDPISMIRFMHEAQIHGRIVHPNICRIYDVDTTEGAPRIAMQLVKGPTLADATRSLTLEEIVTLLAQVAEAVHAAHRLKLIHRDLKPSNILLERDPEGRWVPYVCDFGLAMAQDEPALTASQAIKGTPAYMAPEQIRGDRNRVGPATDVYALGGTLYYALFQEPPRGFPLAEEVVHGRRFKPIPLPRPAGFTLPRELEFILRRCLEPDPEQRYPSAAALAEDLWRFRDGVPIRTRPRGRLAGLAQGLHRHGRKLLLAGLATALLGGAFALEEGRQRTAGRRREEWGRYFTLQAADLEQDLRMEKLLPIHDMRPAFGRFKLRMDGLQERMRALGPEALGPGHYALGRSRFLLRDYQGARTELERAWNHSFQGPEVAYLLARSLITCSGLIENPVHPPTLPGANPAERAALVEDLFRQGKGLARDPDEFATAALAFLRRDFGQAAAAAATSFRNHPWHYESASIEAISLAALGTQSFEAGDLGGARERYDEAMAAARRFLAVGPSDAFLHHLYFRGARGLAGLGLEQGSLDLAFLDALQKACESAQRLDPDDPELQDDRLFLGYLKGSRLADLGRDPGPELAAARAYLETRVAVPLSPELKADRMLLLWRLAENEFRRGRDPGPLLAEALREPAATPFLSRDYLAELLLFKARTEAERGLDPRPSVTAALASVTPRLDQSPSWLLCETAARAWLLRGEWEAGHGQDPRESLARARDLSEQALHANPGSCSAYALNGLARVLELHHDPERSPLKVLLARERLRLAEGINRAGEDQARLRRALATFDQRPAKLGRF
jgi:serine/threonine-protein kinase